ncbi:hypothetical protein, partial [Taylorella equigenitalis]|uniref:hypothetical protein n=1 Tax=Taylorella equigenitalis TaxID=29575 RepID=UPI0039EEAD0D
CVRHSASVQSEPGSNSSVQFLLNKSLTYIQSKLTTDMHCFFTLTQIALLYFLLHHFRNT